MRVIVLSLFDGMSCGQIALNKLGMGPDLYMASEVDASAIKVTQKNFPVTKQMGDVTRVSGRDMPRPDLLIGGSPCQGFSFAGKMLNFEDPRSRLFFEYVRILEECSPRFFLLENVVMKKEHEDVISKALGVKPVLINSSLVSAQNRRRLYWTNLPGVSQPADMNIGWGSVRERGQSSHKYFYTHKAVQWLASMAAAKGRRLKVHSAQEKMQMLEASHHKKYSLQRFFAIADDDPGLDPIKYPTWGGKKSPQSAMELRGGVMVASAGGKDHEVTRPGDLPPGKFALRYITPLECERLQNVPDGYTSCVSDTQRYRMLGNGWTVDVISHILSSIPK